MGKQGKIKNAVAQTLTATSYFKRHVYLSNIAPTVTVSRLRQSIIHAFYKYNPLLEVEVDIIHPRRMEGSSIYCPLGNCIVSFPNFDTATIAVENLNNLELERGKRLVAGYALSKGEIENEAE